MDSDHKHAHRLPTTTTMWQATEEHKYPARPQRQKNDAGHKTQQSQHLLPWPQRSESDPVGKARKTAQRIVDFYSSDDSNH
jgi:hypothetical protein